MRGLKSAKFEHPRVTYAVNKNKRLVQEVIDDMEKAVAESDEMKKFTKEREELAKKHCVNDDNGQPKLKKVPGKNPGEIQMIYDIEGQNDEKSAYRKDLTKVEKKFKEEIEKHEAKVKKYNEEFLDDVSEYETFMVPLTLMEAHEKCPQPTMDLIFWMVDDTK
ncbi:MAG: hypothetical protein DRI97_01245 [Bacteroidetes bacterium]|nr:MAG: hypothetical protein DRI97_01245 [Bacteroidota bacterium]